MTPLLRKILGFNWILIFFILALSLFGLQAIESAARHLSMGGAFYAERQKIWLALGLAIFTTISFIDYKWILKISIPLYVISLVLMIVATFKGNEVHQLSLGSLLFQPTQLGITSGILLLGFLLQELPKRSPFFSIPFVKLAIIALIVGPPFLIVIKMGDMGSALVWMPVTFVIMLVAGIPYRYLALLLIVAFAFIPPAYYIVLPKVSQRGEERIKTYLAMLNDEEVDINGDAYAPYWVATAIGKAGWKGLGWKASAQDGSLHDKKYIPWKTAHNDFIFGVIGEEQGFRGSLLLLMGFGILLLQCLFIAFYSRDFSGRIISSGIVALLFAHLFENIGMCVGLLPITGIPLPFVSYSGTFMLIVLFLMGIVQSIWVHRNAIEEPEEEPISRAHVRYPTQE